uniref:carcinoembryonic antigen-related cell adhesion molecule 19 n=1 Tax=Jaculus jaculus TaxID=51337 RepID=UPI001E1B2B95|nr:carcinoembryonic antigen-related cell adhesion molecule 19 [Jaculus jaculus]
MEIPTGTQGCFPKTLLGSALILVLWLLQCSQAALHIQKIPEQPQKNKELLLSLHGVPDTFQDFTWYLGEETSGGTRLFTYIPGLQRPQRNGNAMGQRDIIGFPNGSMLLYQAQPSDSGTYHVAVTINPSWTMKAKVEVQVPEIRKDVPAALLTVSPGILAAAIVGALVVGSVLISSLAYLLVARGWQGRRDKIPATEKPELSRNPEAASSDNNIYEVTPSPGFLVSPLSDSRPATTATIPAPPASRPPEPENHHYQDLLHPDPAAYCQLVTTS